MDGKSYSEKANSEYDTEQNWSKVADNAAKKAEEELDKIKRDAQELIKTNKENFNNPKE